MSTKIDKMIEEAQKQLQQIDEQFNRNVQSLQQIRQQNEQLQAHGHEVSSRINTLMELKELGNAAFQQVDDAAVAPATEAASEPEHAQAEEVTQEAAPAQP